MIQENIFNLLYENYKITKPIRLIELFAGYGSQALALKYLNANYESYKIVEWNYKSTEAYKKLHFVNDNKDYSKGLNKSDIETFLFNKGISGDWNKSLNMASIRRLGESKIREIYNNIIATHNLVDIKSVKGKDLDIREREKYNYIMTYSFPCFVAGTLITTERGLVPIEDVKIGDVVQTHDGTWQKVLNSSCTGEKEIYRIRTMCGGITQCTPNHLFYVRKKYHKWNNTRHSYDRMFDPPVYRSVEVLYNTNPREWYCGMPINTNSKIPKWDGISFDWNNTIYSHKHVHSNEISKIIDREEFWWIIGRWAADGWQRHQGGIIIACDESEIENFTSRAKKLNISINITHDRTTERVHIPRKEWSKFTKQFGHGALHKYIPQFVMDLPVKLLKAFLDGYVSGDGCLSEGVYKATSVSRKLIYGLVQIIAKVYHRPASVYFTKTRPTHIIEGRVVNQHNRWSITWKTTNDIQDKAFCEDGYIWYPIKDITPLDKVEKVYDITVENSHSFVANNQIVHNCQDLSLAGKREGMQDTSTRSGMLWEVGRILKELKEDNTLPDVLLMENVPEVHGSNNVEYFNKWQLSLENMGYKNYFQDLIATDYGIPQTRNRCFMVSILGDYNYVFPKAIPLKTKLSDFLEENVPEKYFLSDKMINCFMKEDTKGFNRKEHFLKTLKNQNVSRTITTRNGSRSTDTFIVSNKCLEETFMKNDIEKVKDVAYIDGYNRKIRDDGLSNTITTRINESNNSFLLIKNKTKKGYLVANAYDRVDISPLMKYHRGIVQKEKAHTLTTSMQNGVTIPQNNNLRIRKLTPRECFRLMGVKDEDFDKISYMSNNLLYHLAGDSIVVNVLMAIFNQMLDNTSK